MSKTFKISVVIPIYNVENYLEETIESVINQTIGFEDNIQMILVNDGSPDNSEDICLKYKELYPDNVVYIKQENAGVSAARNHGLEYVQGEYVNFLDSDDKWRSDAYEKIIAFFDENKEHIDVVACRLEYFEREEGFSHPLNFKFQKDRIIDIEESPNLVQMHMASCIIKKSSISNVFNQELKYGEDALFINEIIMKKRKYAVMKSVSYLYRKRMSESSALDNCVLKYDYYDHTLIHFHDRLIQLYQDTNNEIPLYIQYILMYDLQWRIKRKLINSILNEEESTHYKQHIRQILQYIEDSVIVAQRNIYSENQYFVLCFKYGRDLQDELSIIGKKLYFKDTKLLRLDKKNLIRFTNLRIKNQKLILEGINYSYLDLKHCEFYIKVIGGRVYKLQFEDLLCSPKEDINGIHFYEKVFRVEIPIENTKKMQLKLMLCYKENQYVRLNYFFKELCGFNQQLKFAYRCEDAYILSIENKILNIETYSILKQKYYEERYRLQIKKLIGQSKKSLKDLDVYDQQRTIEKIENLKEILVCRKLYWKKKNSIKKNIWIISDRINKANDNGEHFFKYMQSVNDKEIDTYFAISKDSSDYLKMKNIGKVIDYNSREYKVLFLLSDKIISSQINQYVVTLFGKERDYIKDLYHFDTVFLQHGITKDDISGWVNRFAKNIALFVTAAKPEYQSIIDGSYFYSTKEAKLTGFPRYDYLQKINHETEEIKQIIIIPTWRKYIQGVTDSITGESIYSDAFKYTEYFKFYNDLINDDRLCRCMKEHGYKGKFCLHPSFTNQYKDFQGNDCFEINEGFVDYQKEFALNKLLVTDYSSVFFDFAFLKKPVIYTQFDKEIIYNGHLYSEGYFDYEEHGFGPVTYSLDQAVFAIMNLIEKDCYLDEKYEKRIEDFYGFFDSNNCQRVYEAIKEI